MKTRNKAFYLFFAILLVSVGIRACLFFTYWGNLRHGSSEEYGSAAIGFFSGYGLSITDSEVKKLEGLPNNYTGNYLSFSDNTNRKIFTEFLPGPALLLSTLWKILPIYNFSPYIWLQIILESFLITIFYYTFRNIGKTIVMASTILIAFNPVAIKYTLTPGYDFWPYFCVLVNFIGITIALTKKKPGFWLLSTGILTAITIWCRSITSLLPFFIVIFLVFYWRWHDNWNYRKIGANAAMYLIAVIIAFVSLSAYRYELTGNFRPTRSTLWHSFWGGVGQFSNPYNLNFKDQVDDQVIWEFGKTLNNELKKYTVKEMYLMPNSPYEQTLKDEAIRFVRNNPHLFVRNIFYRIGMMISPVFYKNSEMMSKNLASYLIPGGVALLLAWIFGMYELFRHSQPVFWLTVTIYSYFFSTIGSIYVVGRAILPLLFINILIYLFGLQLSVRSIKSLIARNN